MAKESQEDIRKAFTTIREKFVDTKQKMSQADMQIEKLKKLRQRDELTIKEITSYTPRMYESVGRMFILNKPENIKADLEKKMKIADEEIQTLENRKTYLQQTFKEYENNVRETIENIQHVPKVDISG